MTAVYEASSLLPAKMGFRFRASALLDERSAQMERASAAAVADTKKCIASMLFSEK
jgi:hypothetical protein